MRHKVAPAPLRFAFYLTQHLVAPPRSAYHVSWYYILCPRSAAHTTCSGLRPTISCGQGSAYLLHLAPPSAVLYLVPLTMDTYYIWGLRSAVLHLVLQNYNTTTYRGPPSGLRPTPLNTKLATVNICA